MERVTLEVDATDGRARTGTVRTARGSIPVPCFMPVGTRGAVRTLTSEDLADLGAPVVLGNTYHLMLRPGAKVIAGLGGLHRFMGWSGHLLTDSGGYQVFSLDPAVDDDGVTFRSTYDGTSHRLTPEGAVAVQADLGADIQMALDVCPALPAPPPVLRLAVDRTAAWAERARHAFEADPGAQALFGIVQGGTDVDLRVESAERTVAVGFDGYALGGFSVGESREETRPALAAATSALPVDRPRYLMGVGDPMGLIEGIGLGVDLFDSVLPTRHARHATLLTASGPLNLRNARFATDPEPIDPECRCRVCARWSRGYLRHLFLVGEPAAARLATLHNLAWTLALVDRAAEAIRRGRFDALRSEIGATWG